VEIEGVPIPLISIDDLIETKRTGRLQDAADIEVLEEINRYEGREAAAEAASNEVAFAADEPMDR
jgi:hypothetical protein